MLKQTPNITFTTPTKVEPTESRPPCLVKCYADAPDGLTPNKLLCYQVHDFDHALNLLERLTAKDWRIRKAFFTNAKGLNTPIPINFNNQ